MSEPRSLFRTPSRLLVQTRYVLEDYILLRASIPVIFISLVAWAIIRSTLQSKGSKLWSDPRFIAGIHSAYGSFSAVLLYFTVFLAVIAVMTVDRTTGYYRLFFSKPVNVVSYYLHTFAVHGVALCALLAVFAIAWSMWMPHESIHRGALVGVLAFALIGGLGFGFGALTDGDAALTPLSFIFAVSAQTTLIGYTGPPKWLVVVAKILPPATDFEKLRAQLNAAQSLASSSLWHVLAYGAGGWILGLIFLRWRPIAR
jgi:hypothetical protein